MYKKFSDFYDQLVFDIDYEKYSNNIKRILSSNNIHSGKILEIGAGTGNLTRKLAKLGDFNILAFDNSLKMMSHATEKLKNFGNVDYIYQDMFEFNFNLYEFEAVVSLLDVINYITEIEDLEYIFKSIYESLKYGGVFIFDINSKYKLLEILGNNTYVYEKDDIFYTWENTIDEEFDDLVYFDLNFFYKEKDGKYSRVYEEQVERYHSIETITNILINTGFTNIKYFDEDGGEYKENKTQRILFCAKK
ncbi:MAG: methyltransferase domain-containing protein [Helcococcus sp.]|nr:methyltransferase domain-containing protein [Helcococcus sp.]